MLRKLSRTELRTSSQWSVLEMAYLWKADRNASRDGFGFVKNGIRTNVKDFVSAGLFPRSHTGSKKINIRRRSVRMFQNHFWQSSCAFNDVHAAVNSKRLLQCRHRCFKLLRSCGHRNKAFSRSCSSNGGDPFWSWLS